MSAVHSYVVSKMLCEALEKRATPGMLVLGNYDPTAQGFTWGMFAFDWSALWDVVPDDASFDAFANIAEEIPIVPKLSGPRTYNGYYPVVSEFRLCDRHSLATSLVESMASHKHQWIPQGNTDRAFDLFEDIPKCPSALQIELAMDLHGAMLYGTSSVGKKMYESDDPIVGAFEYVPSAPVAV